MDSQGDHQLHVFCVPLTLVQGHMLPMVELAKVFAKHGAEVSLIAAPTPHNPAAFEEIINQTGLHPQVKTHLLQFPSSPTAAEADQLHQNNSSYDHDDGNDDDGVKSLSGPDIFQEPLKRLVEEHRPHCIVSDFLLPWTVAAAIKFGIPRLTFTGSGFFSRSVTDSLQRYRPHEGVGSDGEPFLVPGLPHGIRLTRAQLPDIHGEQSSFAELWGRVREAESRSFGIVMNSFHELEGEYVEHLKSEMRKKAWAVGPLSLANGTTVEMAERGKRASSIRAEDCLKWLNSKTPESVVYVCFGSMCRLSAGQLLELALALEASDRPFLWAVGHSASELPEDQWLPEGLERRGVIIRGWAPQVPILSHPAVGAFVTHCGWNSIVESVSAGVAMITWPIFAEQFYNEKLITDVLKIGVPVGSEVWVSWENPDRPLISKEKIETAIAVLMDGGDEARGMRKRVKELGGMALRAIEAGGSSDADMSRLIKELKMRGP